jgi:hypothetical protein
MWLAGRSLETLVLEDRSLSLQPLWKPEILCNIYLFQKMTIPFTKTSHHDAILPSWEVGLRMKMSIQSTFELPGSPCWSLHTPYGRATVLRMLLPSDLTTPSSSHPIWKWNKWKGTAYTRNRFTRCNFHENICGSENCPTVLVWDS